MHPSTEQLGGYGRGVKVLTTALPTGKSTRPLGVPDRSEMVLDTHLCSPVVSERASSARGHGCGGFV